MKPIVILGLIIMSALFNPLYAQVLSNNLNQGSSDIKEKLVTLAIQNPELEIADHQINIATTQLKQSKTWLANDLSVSFNANEFTIKRLQGKKQPDGQYYPFYPFYNVGLNIPIGDIFSKPKTVKIAREQVAIAEASRNSKYREIRDAVLSAYEDYITNKELLTVQSQITESLYSDFLQAKEKFRNGQIDVDSYNQAAKLYHNQLIDRIGAEHDFNLSKIKLESLIGVPLNQVLLNNSEKDLSTPSDSSSVPH